MNGSPESRAHFGPRSGSAAAPPAVLALETSTTRGSVAALVREQGAWQLAAHAAEDEARSQTRTLFPMVERVLADAGLQPEDLGGLVVGVGPGTFTGVRIGVAAARAAALALGITLIGRTALSALAARAVLVAPAGVDRLIPTIDARRGQVFAAVYERAEGGWLLSRAPFAIDPDRLEGFREELDHSSSAEGVTGSPFGTWVVGDGRVAREEWLPSAEFLVLGQEALQQAPSEGPSSEETYSNPSPAADLLVDLLAAGTPRPGEPGSPEAVRPLYVRAPDADQHIKKMKDPWA